jgi:Peptidoglycan-binding protein, CsiV
MTNFHFFWLAQVETNLYRSPYGEEHSNAAIQKNLSRLSRLRLAMTVWTTLLLLFPLPTFAVTEPNWITVEIILFEPTNLEPGMQKEGWPIRPGFPNLANAIELNADESYTVLPKTQWQLNESEKKLTNSGQYRVVFHTAWKQPLLGEKKAIPIHLTAGRQWDKSLPNFSGETIPWEIEGTLKLYNARFIHADADFILQIPASSDSASDNFKSINHHTIRAVNPDNWRPRTKTQLQYFRLTHAERIKAKEIYYFDHPLLGLIIRIS